EQQMIATLVVGLTFMFATFIAVFTVDKAGRKPALKIGFSVMAPAVSQVPRYEFIKRDISWQSPVFFTPVDKQGGLKEAELKALIL
ncbi:MFS transporter, partial [Salmonella enterica subsp. enterica serovar Kentucky]|nr:MFS transporter [Salmonella enterica subsp. enterica serovar Kentucky]